MEYTAPLPEPMNFTLLRLVQPAKTGSALLTTASEDSGMVRLDKPLQSLKAPAPTWVVEDSSRLVIPAHLENACCPMDEMLGPRMRPAILVHPLNAYSPMTDTELSTTSLFAPLPMIP